MVDLELCDIFQNGNAHTDFIFHVLVGGWVSIAIRVHDIPFLSCFT